jgi:hypothetical protein
MAVGKNERQQATRAGSAGQKTVNSGARSFSGQPPSSEIETSAGLRAQPYLKAVKSHSTAIQAKTLLSA